MGRGFSSSSGGSRGGSSFGGSGSSRGMSRSSAGRGGMHGGGHWGRHHHTTVIVGGGHHYHNGGSPIIGIVVGAIFVLVGFFIIIGGFSSCASSNKYSTVQATCTDNDYVNGWYYTTYEYTVDGTEYTNRSSEGWEIPETVGKVVTIYYLKSDPNVITEENPNDNGEGGVIVFAGLICAGLGALSLVLSVKELKNKNTQSINDGETSETVKEETHNKCPYCGSKYNKNSDSCPKCGASKMD